MVDHTLRRSLGSWLIIGLRGSIDRTVGYYALEALAYLRKPVRPPQGAYISFMILRTHFRVVESKNPMCEAVFAGQNYWFFGRIWDVIGDVNAP